METQAQASLSKGRKRLRRHPTLTIFGLCSLFAALTLDDAAGKKSLQMERALSEQERLAAEQPGNASIYNDLGNLLVLAGRLKDAEVAYRRSLELDPSSARAHFNLGLLYASQNETRAALRAFRRTLELDPRNAWAHYEKGKIYLARGLKRAAERAFAQAFRLDPRLADSRYNPHVLENPVATRALLRSGRLAGQDHQAPLEYEEGKRIARLLLDFPENRIAVDPGEPSSTTGGSQQADPGFRSGSRLEPAPPENAPEEPPLLTKEADASQPLKLTAEDLSADTPNQVKGGRAGGFGDSDRSRAKWEAMKPWQVPSPGVPPPPPPDDEEPPTFEPGLDSTGRLKLRLDPTPRLASLRAPL